LVACSRTHAIVLAAGVGVGITVELARVVPFWSGRQPSQGAALNAIQIAEFLSRNHWASETVDDLNYHPSRPREVLMTEASTGTGSPSRAALPAGPVWRAGLLAAIAATVVNVVAWLVLQPLLDADLQIPRTPGSTDLVSLSLAPVILVTLLSGVLGAVVLWLLTRRGRRASACG
jgi:hypothetical protein